MADNTKTSWNFVWVKDRAGNEYACQVDALRPIDSLSAEELETCFADGDRPLAIGD